MSSASAQPSHLSERDVISTIANPSKDLTGRLDVAPFAQAGGVLMAATRPARHSLKAPIRPKTGGSLTREVVTAFCTKCPVGAM